MDSDLTKLRNKNLLRQGKAAHLADDSRLYRAVLKELKGRTSKLARQCAAELGELGSPPTRSSRGAVVGDAAPSARWSKRASSVIKEFVRGNDGGGDRSVYVALLRDDGRFGLYVGKTGLTADERFANHKRGHKASKVVKNYGVKLMQPVIEGLEEKEAKSIERRLKSSLEREGFDWVAGGH